MKSICCMGRRRGRRTPSAREGEPALCGEPLHDVAFDGEAVFEGLEFFVPAGGKAVLDEVDDFRLEGLLFGGEAKIHVQGLQPQLRPGIV
ncbi:hypothetical protein O0235_01390 [Tepidiforma flava]|uniref:Uncharacterized protein n=1 Tax=Tepidiforma flava TaxID=3004094 RepID=A0ABY7M6Z2_9CHLR|nr:hypothetical protein [Tepidiforma flava]WBL36278.1 hypothetical protein O0235_01390 [Tepidiforma flava]